ncbi:replication protein [Siminovitchia terrae]|uniref:replication protein n=1 Tax=Siminovitchia terrae TaxID=1914933 RepID=UPI0028B034D9|nr:replication protein [Siminovitchia terrae]
MANVQLEHGFTKIANELLDAIQSFQFTQNQFKLLLALWRNTYGWNRKECDFSLNKLVSQTGLQKKRVIETLRSLEESNIIIEVKAPVGSSGKIVRFNKNYDSWTIKKYKSMELSSGHGDTPRVGHDDTPINTKEILNTKTLNTAADVAGENGLLTEEISSQESESEIYIRKLLNRFIELRAHGFDYKPVDLNAAKEIQKAGVPLAEALSSLETAFRNYNPRHSRDRIHSLSYCVGFILDQHFPPVKQNKPKRIIRQEKLPDWFDKPESESNNVIKMNGEDSEARRKRLEAIQQKYKQGG